MFFVELGLTPSSWGYFQGAYHKHGNEGGDDYYVLLCHHHLFLDLHVPGCGGGSLYG